MKQAGIDVQNLIFDMGQLHGPGIRPHHPTLTQTHMTARWGGEDGTSVSP